MDISRMLRINSFIGINVFEEEGGGLIRVTAQTFTVHQYTDP